MKVLIVDGYNAINEWDELKEESIHSLEVSRQKLLDIMSNYQGYIERYVAGLYREDHIKVATSDRVEQIMVLGLGAVRLPVRELILEVAAMKKSMNEKYLNKLESKRNLLENSINPKIRSTLEKWRRENTKT